MRWKIFGGEKRSEQLTGGSKKRNEGILRRGRGGHRQRKKEENGKNGTMYRAPTGERDKVYGGKLKDLSLESTQTVTTLVF